MNTHRRPNSLNSALGGRRRSFTLIEMMIALAVLIVALSVIATVFGISSNTAAQAAASSDLLALMRNTIDNLREDLSHCDPARSVLVIVGRTQPAALTQDKLNGGQYYRFLTGDPNAVPVGFDPATGFIPLPPAANTTQYSEPRADLLMFFTDRQAQSLSPPTGLPADSFQATLQNGAKVAPEQIVYGHADLTQAVGGNPPAFSTTTPTSIEDLGTFSGRSLSKTPANRWVLARRQAIIQDVTGDPNFVTPKLTFNGDGFGNDASGDEFLRIRRCYSEDASRSGDSAKLSFQAYLDTLSLYATTRPYTFALGGPPNFWDFIDWPNVNYYGLTGRQMVYRVLYDQTTQVEPKPRRIATVIDQPPASLSSNLGIQQMPGCVWFQVEFLMPEDPRNSLDTPLADQRDDMPRWVEVPPDETYVFVPDSTANRTEISVASYGQNANLGLNRFRLGDFASITPPAMYNPTPADLPPTADMRRVRLWPYAIRVTLRAYDRNARLDAPLTRTLVYRFP